MGRYNNIERWLYTKKPGTGVDKDSEPDAGSDRLGKITPEQAVGTDSERAYFVLFRVNSWIVLAGGLEPPIHEFTRIETK